MAFDYLLNDPSTPHLRKNIDSVPLPANHPPFHVYGFNGLLGSPGSIELKAAQVYATVAYALDAVQKNYRGGLRNWPGTNNLVLFPQAGNDLNAYYDRSAIRLFSGHNKHTKTTAHTCMSADVVSHELGHAVLDAIRPDMWSVATLEIMAFHESFGDMLAILTCLQHDEVINHILQETGGDLTKTNSVTHIAEEMGSAIYPQHPNFLRNAANDFVYVEPERLPVNGPDERLAQEPHNFSRVFTAAFWETLANIHARYAPSDSVTAVRTARDIMARLLLNALPMVALTPRLYKSLLKAMLVVDRNLHNGEVSDILQRVFAKRGIARDISFLMPHPLHKQKISLPLGHQFSVGNEKVVRSGKVSQMKLRGRDELVYKIDNPLYDVQVEVPNEIMVRVDKFSRQIDRMEYDMKSTIRCVQAGLDYLHLRKDTTFGIVDGKLTRLRSC